MNRRAVIGVAAAAVAVVVAVGGVATWVLTRPESAEHAAGRYLAALSDGDFAEIEPLLPDSVEAAELEQLRSAFTGATEYLHDDDYTLSDAGDGRRRVDADVRLGGEERTIAFVLGPTSGGWELSSDYLGLLDVSTSLGDAVHVGDALTGLSVRLLPAVYPVRPAPAGLLDGGTDVAVTSPDATTASIQPSLTPDATRLAQQQLDAYASQCAAATQAVPEHCGLRVPWAADLASLDAIAFRIDTPPIISLAPEGGSFAATGGVIVATASGTDRGGSAASFTYRADDWTLRGSIEFAGDEMALLVD